MKSKLILTILLLSSVAFACPKPVQYLESGKKANCSGYLFSVEAEQEARLNTIRYEKLLEISQKKDELTFTLDEQVKNLQEHNNHLTTELRKREDSSFWKSTVYFALGVLVTGAIASNVGN